MKERIWMGKTSMDQKMDVIFNFDIVGAALAYCAGNDALYSFKKDRSAAQ